MKLVLTLLTCMTLGLNKPVQNVIEVKNADDPITEPIDTPETKTGTVILTATEHGEVLADVETGNVGDKVTLYVKAYFLYSITSVQMNETDLIANDKGNYEFYLVEGDNVVTATFKVNNAEVEEIAKVIDSIKENGIESLFTMDNLMTLIYFVISAIFSSGFFVSLIRTKKIKSQTINDISIQTKKVLEKCTKEEIVAFLQNTIQPIVEKTLTKIDEVNEISTTLCECFILAQENTPEARLAIIDKLTKMQTTNKELSDKIREIILEQQTIEKAKIEERNQTLQELKDANNSIEVVEEKEEKENDEIGQL